MTQYTDEEQLLIQELINCSSQNSKQVANFDTIAELLAKKAGDITFNAKLRDDKSNLDTSIKAFLTYFTYKTRNLDQLHAIQLKLDTAIELLNQGLDLDDSEKISLSDFRKIHDIQSLYAHHGSTLMDINDKAQNEHLNSLYNNIESATCSVRRFESLIGEALDYKSGDLMMSLINKTSALKGKQDICGHEGKLEKIFMTKYSHAAPIYIHSSMPMTSHIVQEHCISNISLSTILSSDTFRVDPTKLVDPKHIANLEKIDYGYKKNNKGKDILTENGEKIKLTWQDIMKERYEILSQALHKNFQKQIDLNNTQKITNDPIRISGLHWLKPQAIIDGHNKWFSENDFRDLSKQMYHASPDQKKMICSEFAARSISATIDQLNKLTAIDLQSEELIKQEETIIKSPISKKENFATIHPQRLVEILEKSACLEKMPSTILDKIITFDQIKDLTIKDTERNSNLSNKIYKILQKSRSSEEFQNTASKVIETYLKAAQTEEDVISKAKDRVLNNQLPNLYAQHKMDPKSTKNKISHFCKKVLEFCKIITKDDKVRRNLNTMVNNIDKMVTYIQKETHAQKIEEKLKMANIAQQIIAS